MIPVQLHLRPHAEPLKASLRVPDEEEECPILQEPIISATLDRFPRPYSADHPAHKALTLQCRHTFHAMSLVYHWARNGNVLCPVCRAGPKGQRLVMSRLPREWKHSMSVRVRKERQQDQRDQEEQNRHLAMQTVHQPATLELDIRIEAEAGTTPPFWTVRTHILVQPDSVVFSVPLDELRRVPYGPSTLVRLLPYTRVHMLRPSNWFRAGVEPENNFSVSYSEDGFESMLLVVSEEIFGIMVADVFLAHRITEGFALLVSAYP